MKKLILTILFFIFTPTVVLYLTFFLLLNTFAHQAKHDDSNFKVAFAALPYSSGVVKSKIVSDDARIFLVKNFFKKYKSELLPFAKDVVSYADKYDLDYRLIPAIAMQESTLCKKAPKN